MRLIIDIPEEKLNIIKNKMYCGIYDPDLYKAIADSTPLDDVKAEIEKQIKRDIAFAETETFKVPCHYGTANGLQVATRIIDNICKVEREDT